MLGRRSAREERSPAEQTSTASRIGVYTVAIILGIAPLSALIGFTLGTILGGLATPTEAASCGAVPDPSR